MITYTLIDIDANIIYYLKFYLLKILQKYKGGGGGGGGRMKQLNSVVPDVNEKCINTCTTSCVPFKDYNT